MNVSAPGSPAMRTKRVYYTNKNSSGTAINSQVKVGYAVVYDLANAGPGMSVAESAGLCVTQPETAYLGVPAGIVTSVSGLPTTSGGVVNGDAGWIEICDEAASLSAWTHANMTLAATRLIGSNGQWYLVAASSSPDTPAEEIGSFGVALETHDSSSTSANKRIQVQIGR